jgi:uncharacterized membrane protein YdjX (TVP38/TMEM64 family)
LTKKPEPTRGERRELILRLMVVGLAGCVLVTLLVSGVAPTPSEIREWGDDLGPWAAVIWPFVFTGLNLLLPWNWIAGATGLIFGAALGSVLSMAGVLMCTCVQFLAARYVLGDQIRSRVLGRFPRADRILEQNDGMATFYSRLIPLVPWGVVNYISGLARVRLSMLLLATLTAGAPKVIAYSALGGSLDDLSSPTARISIAALVLMGIGGAILGRHQYRSERGT